jgi:hypothetical protein
MTAARMGRREKERGRAERWRSRGWTDGLSSEDELRSRARWFEHHPPPPQTGGGRAHSKGAGSPCHRISPWHEKTPFLRTSWTVDLY